MQVRTTVDVMGADVFLSAPAYLQPTCRGHVYHFLPLYHFELFVLLFRRLLVYCVRFLSILQYGFLFISFCLFVSFLFDL